MLPLLAAAEIHTILLIVATILAGLIALTGVVRGVTGTRWPHRRAAGPQAGEEGSET